MRCSVRELLDRFDSLEISEWRAFERAFGPIGTEYTNATLAAIHEQLQTVAYMVGAQYGDDSPVDPPQPFPRPPELFLDRDDLPERESAQPAGNADELNAFFDQ